MKKLIAYSSLLIASLLPVFLNFYPNYYAFLNTPRNMVFLGQASWFDPWDINLYASAIKSGQTNGFLLANLYTTTPNQPILMYPLYTIIGMLFKNLDPFFLFHFSAGIFGIILALGIYKLLAYFFENITERLIALTAICLGGGFGFLLFPNIQSADVSMTAFTFQSAFQRPHEALAILCYLSALIFFFKNKIFIASFFSLIACFFYPFNIISLTLIAGVYLFIKNKSELKIANYLALIYLLIPSLLIVFFLSNQISANETFRNVLSQNLPTPNPLFLLSGYGIITLLIIYDLLFIKRNDRIIFLLVWFVTSFLLSLAPFGFSRFFLRGLFFPGVIISIFAINDLVKRTKINVFLFSFLFLIFLLPTNLRIFFDRINETTKNNPWYYISKQQFEGIEYLKSKTPKKSGVIALYNLGNLIPAYTNNTVYFGHLLQTPNANEKLQSLYLFYSNSMTKDQAKNFLGQNRISYILFGKEEKTLAKKLNYSFLSPIFSNTDIVIFSTK